MERINMTELIAKVRADGRRWNKPEDYLEWMLLALTNDKIMKSLDLGEDSKKKPIVLDVHVTINDVEVKLSEICKRLAESFDKEVEAQAKKITAKVVRDAKAKLREVVDPLTAVVKNVLRDQEA